MSIKHSVATSHDSTILWKKQSKTDSILPYNKPNIVIRDNKEDMSVTDRAISGDRNVIKKET
jgi:hypothetical protein